MRSRHSNAIAAEQDPAQADGPGFSIAKQAGAGGPIGHRGGAIFGRDIERAGASGALIEAGRVILGRRNGAKIAGPERRRPGARLGQAACAIEGKARRIEAFFIAHRFAAPGCDGAAKHVYEDPGIR